MLKACKYNSVFLHCVTLRSGRFPVFFTLYNNCLIFGKQNAKLFEKLIFYDIIQLNNRELNRGYPKGADIMKKFKKILSVIIAAVIVLCSACPAASAKKNEPELKFGDDGKFRIMHITDTHYTDFPFEESIAFIGKALDDYQPDLVVFGGDNIKGWFDTSMQLGVKAAINQLVAPLEERDIPFTFVYGNHDWQTYLCPKVLQNSYYSSHSNCIMPDGYSTVFRAGNGSILIKDSSGEKNIFNLWLLDSGTIIDTGTKRVESVNSVQLSWYRRTCEKLAKQNGGEVIPSLVFQHFPVEEVTMLFDEAEGGVKCGDKAYTLKAGLTDGITNGTAGTPDGSIGTHLNKSVEMPSKNNGEYSAWVDEGDVIGAFFGHSHVNDYCGITDDGIILGATLSAGGFNIASRFDDENGSPVEARGLRVIDIDENVLLDEAKDNTEAISTFSVYYSDYFTGSVEKYPSKYKAFDEHDFGEWIKIEFSYFKDFILGIFVK